MIPPCAMHLPLISVIICGSTIEVSIYYKGVALEILYLLVRGFNSP
jgi:hypothetical protein